MKFTCIKSTVWKWTSRIKSSDPIPFPHAAFGLRASLLPEVAPPCGGQASSAPLSAANGVVFWSAVSHRNSIPFAWSWPQIPPAQSPKVKAPWTQTPLPLKFYLTGWIQAHGHPPLPEPATLSPSCPRGSTEPLPLIPTPPSTQTKKLIPSLFTAYQEEGPAFRTPTPQKTPHL